MEIPPTDNLKSDLCSIKIAFPVDNDDDAIRYKKEIAAVLAGIPDVRIQFSLMNIPAPPVMPKPNG